MPHHLTSDLVIQHWIDIFGRAQVHIVQSERLRLPKSADRNVFASETKRYLEETAAVYRLEWLTDLFFYSGGIIFMFKSELISIKTYNFQMYLRVFEYYVFDFNVRPRWIVILTITLLPDWPGSLRYAPSSLSRRRRCWCNQRKVRRLTLIMVVLPNQSYAPCFLYVSRVDQGVLCPRGTYSLKAPGTC